jgi:hypothetical protein
MLRQTNIRFGSNRSQSAHKKKLKIAHFFFFEHDEEAHIHLCNMSAAFMRNEPLTLSDIIPFSQT